MILIVLIIKRIKKCVCAQCHRPVNNWKIPDNFMRKVIRNKEVNCHAKECRWVGKLEDMFNTHYKVHKSEKQIIKCVYCFKDFESKVSLKFNLYNILPTSITTSQND